MAALFAAIAIASTAATIYECWTGTGGPSNAPWVNGLQSAAGMLFVAVLAATTLSEERVRGSLDVLLTTPLTTPAIVLGKWWGAFRAVLPLVILPGILAQVLGFRSTDRWVLPFLLVGLMLSYGAALTSIGLALSTWISRLGRVMVLTVAVHVLITVGWFFLVIALFNRSNNEIGRDLALASPFFGPSMLTAILDHRPSQGVHLEAGCAVWAAGWIAFYTVTARAFIVATLLSFDRCLGRISDRPGPPQRVRERMPVPWLKPQPRELAE